MSAIERQSVALAYGVVPDTLHFVDALGHKARAVIMALVVAVVFFGWTEGFLKLVLG